MKHLFFITVFLALALSFTAYGQLQFGESKSIGSLQLSKESRDYSTGEMTKTVSLRVSTNEAQKFKIQQQFDLLKIDNLTTVGKVGEPTTYVKSLKVELEKYARITGIKIIDGDYVNVLGKINLAPRGKPVVWMKGAKNDMELKKDMEIYSKDEYFPGKTVNYIAGQGRENTVVYIQLYPVQYNPVKREVLLIKNAIIEISYVIETKQKPTHRSSLIRSDAQNVIITTQAFKPFADSIKNLHETLENITSEVVTTDWIIANYTAAPEPTQPGYANISSNPVNSSYNYDLAKKIVAYLRDEDAHANLESITILGDADKVPPSYYFFINHYDLYNNWICSDLFYASPDYDMVLDFEVGRLPADNLAEAELMFQKLKNWKTNLDASWFKNIQIVGGSPFGQQYLTGEVITLDAVNNSYLKGMNTIGKNFLSNGTQNSSTVLPYFSDENTGLLYHIGHGSGNEMGLGGQSGGITTSNLLNLPSKQKYPAIVSIGCMNGGYDTELMTNEPFNTRCIAEGVMGSQAGGIAYWGGVRVNMGDPAVSYKENGEMIVGDEPLMAGMLTNIFKAWAEGHLTFGEITNEAIGDFITTSGLETKYDKVTLYEFVLFGDPALSILPQESSVYDNVEFSVDPLPHIPGGNSVPIYYKTPTITIPVNIIGATNSPSVNVHICDVATVGNSIITNSLVSTSISTPPFEYLFTPPSEKTFFTCYETADFKETRLYFKTETVDKLPPLPTHLYEIKNVSGGSYDIEWKEAKDYDGEIVSYTLFEGQNLVGVKDSCNSFDKWDNNGFSVSSGGNNSTSCFYSGTGWDHSVSISSSIPYLVKQGEQLSFWKKHDFDEMYDAGSVQIAEVGHGFTTLESFMGTDAWSQTTIDLSDYVGKYVIIKFTSYSTFGMNEGLWIDDVTPVGWYEQIKYFEDIVDTTYHIDDNPVGDYYYKVKAIDDDNLESSWSNKQHIDLTVGMSENKITDAVRLMSQNYPNPFSNSTAISFRLKQAANVNLTIYDMQGQIIRTLVNTNKQAGDYKVVWDCGTDSGQNVGNGIYFYKIVVIPLGDESVYVDTKKMILIR